MGSPEEKHILKIAAELAVRPQQVRSAATLLAEGATVPFIARYRKEATGSLDEVQIATIRDRLEKLAELDKRRKAWKPKPSAYPRGYAKMYIEHVNQSHQGADFDFLVGKSGSGIPRESH